tara:strand:- start:118524 stop:118664 length:141 start_codon:yes stop_codon:yes gene_type:complete
MVSSLSIIEQFFYHKSEANNKDKKAAIKEYKKLPSTFFCEMKFSQN